MRVGVRRCNNVSPDTGLCPACIQSVSSRVQAPVFNTGAEGAAQGTGMLASRSRMPCLAPSAA